ncbi:HK97 family phage prohead protease [Pseudooceanicola sp. 502str34]
MTLQKFDTSPRLSPAFSLEMKASPQGVIEGLASPFGGTPDSYGDCIAPGAFTKSIASHRAAGTMPALLWAHDPSKPVGTWKRIEERPDGLHAEGQLNLKTQAGQEAFEHVKAGDSTGLSIGFVLPAGATTWREGARWILEADLLEVSLVTIPAAPKARIHSVKSLEIRSRTELRDLLREAGLARAAAEKLSLGGWPALAGNETNMAEIGALLRASASKLKG